MKEKYGVEHALQSKEFLEKSMNTCKKHYGVKHPYQSKEIQDKIKETTQKRYGVEFASQSKIFKDKLKKTNLEKYGVEYVFQSKEFKESSVKTKLAKYGVEHQAKSAEIHDKITKHGYKIKKYTLPSGKVICVQGYEPQALDLLLTKYTEADIIVGAKNIEKCIGTIIYEFDGKSRKYFPDIFIKSENKIVEVKSEYTYKADLEKNLAKKNASLEAGLKFEFLII